MCDNDVVKWGRLYTSGSVFLFSALALVFASGYSVGPTLLFLLSIFYLIPPIFCRLKIFPQTKLKKTDVYLMAAFLFYFAILTAEVLWFHLEIRDLDKPVRFLLAIPVLLLLLRCPPHLAALWGGVMVGGLSAGIIAIVQKFVLGYERANGFIFVIQFGDLSMLLGILSVAGIAWCRTQPHAHLWQAGLGLAAIGGITASFLSGSRGGWIGLPLIMFMLARSYSDFMGWRQWIKIGGICIFWGGALAVTPGSGIIDRVHQAQSDVNHYQDGNAETSLGARFDLWRMANYMYGHRPIFGYGTQAFLDMRPEMVERFGYSKYILDLGSAHNEYLDAAAKRGTLGLFALLSIYLVPLALFSRYRRSRDLTVRSLSLAGMLVPLCFMDFGISQVLFTHNSGVMVYPYLLAVLWACLRYRLVQLHWTKRGVQV